MQKWHKTAEICQTSQKCTHFQIPKACYFDLSSFHLQFSFILIDGLFSGHIFVQNSRIIKKFHRKAQADKTELFTSKKSSNQRNVIKGPIFCGPVTSLELQIHLNKKLSILAKVFIKMVFLPEEIFEWAS